MRNRVILAAVAGASALLALAGCATEQSAPAGPTRAQITAYNQKLLDETWRLADLDGVMPKLVTATSVAKSDEAFFDEILACLSSEGSASKSFGWGGDGYAVGEDGSGTVPSLKDRIAMYNCVAEHPRNPVLDNELFSAAQLAYLWTYFSRWQIPCLKLHGYSVAAEPKSAAALAPGNGVWSPYAAVKLPNSSPSLTGDTDRQLTLMKTECGPRLGVMPDRRP